MLQKNQIHLSTLDSDTTRKMAGRFDSAFYLLDYCKVLFFSNLWQLRDANIKKQVTEKLPQFAPLLPGSQEADRRLDRLLEGHWGNPRSLAIDLFTYTVRLIQSSNSDLAKNMVKDNNKSGKTMFYKGRHRIEFEGIMAINHMPWDIISLEETFRMSITLLSALSSHEEDYDHVKYRFSAAAIAIGFLQSIK